MSSAPDPVHPEWRALEQAGLLLTSDAMAHFVARGFLRFDALVDETINRDALASIADGSLALNGGYRAAPLAGSFPPASAIGRLLDLPRVRGILASLIGPDPLYDHHAVHVVPARCARAQNWHADATIDARAHFDVQLLYFPHQTARAMGGTMILPGSHLRFVHEFEVARYQNFNGQLATVCPAGTIVVLHHGIWHCAQPNHTDATRYMVKLRLQPTCRQLRLWDQRGADAQAIARMLTSCEPWFGTDQRLEIIQRLRLWRLLSGDPTFDCDHWLGRLENDPQRRASG
jgi:hypothetical protein